MDIVTRLVVAVVLISTVVVLSTVLGLAMTMPDISEVETNEYDICLPGTDSDGALTCGRMDKQLHDYLERAIQKQFKKLHKDEKETNAEEEKEGRQVQLKQYMKEHYWEIKPAARFTGVRKSDDKDVPSSIYDDGTGMFSIREWRHGRDLHANGGFQRYGMTYRKGRIVVPVSGTYSIYSFVDMYEPCKDGVPTIDKMNSSIQHAIFKFNILDGRDTELVCNTQPHQMSANKYFNIYSSYVSSLFELNAGDELSVKVSNLTYLQYPEANYFGVNLI